MKPDVFNYADYEALKAENEALKKTLKSALYYIQHDCDTCKFVCAYYNEEPCNRCSSEADKWEWRGVSNDRT